MCVALCGVCYVLRVACRVWYNMRYVVYVVWLCERWGALVGVCCVLHGEGCVICGVCELSSGMWHVVHDVLVL